MSFSKMSREELYRVAVEEFAVDVKPEDTKKVILAALEEDGVTWKMYTTNHPELAVAEKPVEEVPADVVVVEEETVTTPVIRTREEPVDTATEELYLIKMDRDNPRFEFGRYKFTKSHPFAVMPADDADKILREEEGFSIATPSEASEYYQKG